MTDLLTPAERVAVATGALLANQVAEIVADGPSRDADIAEAVHHIHAVQRMILAQAAARAYPGQYRLLGDTVKLSPPTWWTKPAEPDNITAAVDAYKRERGL
jgi:hypothetical protein